MRRTLLTTAFAAITLGAQTAPSPTPAFEVASVKPNKSNDQHSSTNVSRGNGGGYDSARLTMTNVNLQHCIEDAYRVRAYQIEGPEWLRSETYDIVGTIPAGAAPDDIWPMLQTLLGERFKLALHRETRSLPIFELVVAKNGPKIEAVDSEGQSGTWQNADKLTARKESMANFAAVLSRMMERPVIDKTGLGGVFDFEIEYSREDAQSSILSALQEKLGLKLEARKGPLEMLVIDHVERVPTEN